MLHESGHLECMCSQRTEVDGWHLEATIAIGWPHPRRIKVFSKLGFSGLCSSEGEKRGLVLYCKELTLQ